MVDMRGIKYWVGSKQDGERHPVVLCMALWLLYAATKWHYRSGEISEEMKHQL